MPISTEIEGDIQTGAAPVTPQRNLGPGVALPNIFAGIQDFGTVTDPDTGETRAKAPVEWLMENVDPSNPLYQAFFGNTGPHTSTSLERLVGPDGTVYYQIAGKTGGPNRERYSQLYVEKGNQLVPVGQGKFYTGEPPDAFVKQFAGKALGMFAGVALPGIGSFIGQALGVSVEIGSAIANVALKLAQGVPLQDALLTAGIQYGAPQVFTDPTVAKIASDLGSAAATGQDMGQAAIKSLVSVAGPQVLENVRPTGDQVFDSGLASAIASAASAKLTGGDVIQSAVSGFTAGVQKASGQQQPSKEEQVAGAGPADYLVGERDPALQQVGFGSTLRGILQSGLAELGSSWLAAGQQLGIAPETLDRAISYLKVIEQGGENLIDADVQQQAKAFTNRIYSAASKPNATASEITQAVVQATLENPLGALTLVSKELVQELPTLLIPGRGVALLGNWALNVAESAGNQALQKIDELRQANPNMTRDQLIAAARNDSGIAAAVTAAVSLIPGANTKVLQPLIEGFNEFLEEGLTTYLTTGDKSKALGNAVLGGVLGGKTATALQTGEQVVDAAQKALPSLGSIEVRSTRLPLDEAAAGEKLSVVPSVVSKDTGGAAIPTGQVPVVNAVVVSIDPKSNTALVVDNTGATKIVNATDATTGAQVISGQTVVLNADGTIKTGGAVDTGVTKVGGDGGGVTKGGTLLTTPQENLVSGGQLDTGGTTPVTTTPVTTAATGFDPNQKATPEIVAELLSLIGFPVSDKTIGFLLTGSPTVKQVGQELQNIAGMVTQRNLQQSGYYDAQTGLPTIQTGPQGQPTIISQYTPDVTPATTPAVAGQADQQVQQAQSPGEVLIQARFQQAGKTASQQDIQNLLNQAQQMGVNLAAANVGTTPQYQSWAQLVYDTANDIQRPSPVFTATSDPVLNLLNRINIDTISTVDTVSGGGFLQDTISLTTPPVTSGGAVDTVRDSIVDTTPAIDTTPVVDTVPPGTKESVREDDVIRLLGLDQTEPTPTVAEQKEPPLSVVTRTVSQPPYTPPPGVRVVEPPGVSPTRVALSEREGEDVYGTPEEEQEPVWNIRSLKLRRALRI